MGDDFKKNSCCIGAAMKRAEAILVAAQGGIGETALRQLKTIEAKYSAKQGIAEESTLKKGMEEKSKEFVVKGAEVYAKA